MTHTRYWAATLATAVCGGFIVIVRFAFSSSSTPWIVFGVAIAAATLSLVAFLVALSRSSHVLSGLSALNVLVGAWTIIAMLTLNTAAAGWLAFACGLGLLIVSLRGLALHETSIERIVHALGDADASPGEQVTGTHTSVRRFTVSASMRSWLSWLTNTAMAVAGGFIVFADVRIDPAGHESRLATMGSVRARDSSQLHCARLAAGQGAAPPDGQDRRVDCGGSWGAAHARGRGPGSGRGADRDDARIRR